MNDDNCYSEVEKMFICSEIENNVAENDVSDTFNLLEALGANYDVIEQILAFLPYADLMSISKACNSFKNWTECIKGTLSRRLTLSTTFMWSEECTIADASYSKPSLCFALIKHPGQRLKLSSYACVHKNGQKAKKHVREYLSNDFLGQSNCPTVVLTCRALFSKPSDGEDLASFALPEIPGVKVSVFRVKAQYTDTSNILEQNIGEHNNVECLFTFSIAPNMNQVKRVIDAVVERQPHKKFALGGGFVGGIVSFNHFVYDQMAEQKRERAESLCVCLSTSKCREKPVKFQAYSLVIPSRSRKLGDLEAHFAEFKEHYIPREHGVVLKVTCVSRSDKPKDVFKVFEKYFPGVSYFEIFGDGEIGWDCYKHEPSYGIPTSKKRKHSPKLFLELTCVYVFLTWGKKIK